jgi:hypothetical protein
LGILTLTLLLTLLTCCSGTTGGALLHLPFRAGGIARDASQPFTFTTASGWTVTLDRAEQAVGPLYFNLSAPPTDQFRGGQVIVQVTQQQVIDLLDPTLHDVAAGADGETGHAVSVEIGLRPPDATQSDDARTLLGQGFAYVSGTARKAGAADVAFAGPLVIVAVLPTSTTNPPLDQLQRVKGAAVDLTFSAAPQRLELRVDPSHWFDAVDFAPLLTAPTTDGTHHTWKPNSVFQTQVLAGVRGEIGVYDFQLVTP